MAKLTMKSLMWLGKPTIWHKDFRHLDLVVVPGTTFPEHAASIVAVGNNDLTATGTLTIPEDGGECGVLVFQGPGELLAVGSHKSGFTVHYQSGGHSLESEIPMENSESSVVMACRREGGKVTVSVVKDNEATELVTATLPGVSLSFSFGYYFSNTTDTSFTASLDHFVVIEEPKTR